MKPEALIAFANSLLAAPAPASLAPTVDRIGLIHAQIAALKEEAETLREELEASGLAQIEGSLYRASLAQCKSADVTNWKAIAERLKASPQLIRAHTKAGKAYTRMNVTAKSVH